MNIHKNARLTPRGREGSRRTRRASRSTGVIHAKVLSPVAGFEQALAGRADRPTRPPSPGGKTHRRPPRRPGRDTRTRTRRTHRRPSNRSPSVEIDREFRDGEAPPRSPAARVGRTEGRSSKPPSAPRRRPAEIGPPADLELVHRACPPRAARSIEYSPRPALSQPCPWA
jgi:hypothetical protein